MSASLIESFNSPKGPRFHKIHWDVELVRNDFRGRESFTFNVLGEKGEIGPLFASEATRARDWSGEHNAVEKAVEALDDVNVGPPEELLKKQQRTNSHLPPELQRDHQRDQQK